MLYTSLVQFLSGTTKNDSTCVVTLIAGERAGSVRAEREDLERIECHRGATIRGGG